MRILLSAGRRGARVQLRHLRPVSPGDDALVARVYAQVEADFGMLVPPVALHAPVPTLLAASWVMLRETLVAGERVDRTTKEVVATAVSLANACPYCVEVHGATLHGLARARAGARVRDVTALEEDRLGDIDDPRLRVIAEWARGTGRLNQPPPPALPAGAASLPFPAAQGPELVGVAVVFHYLNRMVSVFLTDSPFPAQVPTTLRRSLRPLVGWLLRPAAGRHHTPAASLELLPAAPLPGDLAWAAGSPPVAHAFARAAAAIDDVGGRLVPAAVRTLTQATVAAWDGTPPGLSRTWADAAVSSLPESEQAAGRLAVLTAMAAYQVDQTVVDAVRREGADEAQLIGLTAWAAMTTAREMGRRSGRALGGDDDGINTTEGNQHPW